MEGELINALE
jgi:septal ring factor EnvC (AmiA/AmiB activator)